MTSHSKIAQFNCECIGRFTYVVGAGLSLQITIVTELRNGSYAYWTVHHLDIWIKVDQLDDTCLKHVEQYIIKQVSSSWSTFIQIRNRCLRMDFRKAWGYDSWPPFADWPWYHPTACLTYSCSSCLMLQRQDSKFIAHLPRMWGALPSLPHTSSWRGAQLISRTVYLNVYFIHKDMFLSNVFKLCVTI